jgi:phosphatidylserine decarboxylase
MADPFLLKQKPYYFSIIIMYLKLTRYGRPEVAIFPLATGVVGTIVALAGLAGLSGWIVWPAEAVLGVILIWILSFFRDPERKSPAGSNLILSPADGKITDIEVVANEPRYIGIGGKSVRVGIFLSIFDVHLNRAPCNCFVDKITYRKGSFKIACNVQSGRVNESNDLELIRTEEPKDVILVRQISGAIARRIVCEAKAGENLAGGQRFGMIKFGSRTEIYMPDRDDLQLVVKVGDKVKAGVTVIAEYSVQRLA